MQGTNPKPFFPHDTQRVSGYPWKFFLQKFFRLGKALASRLYQVQACDWVHLAQALIPLPWGFYP